MTKGGSIVADTSLNVHPLVCGGSPFVSCFVMDYVVVLLVLHSF